jgi:hypothetical protein
MKMYSKTLALTAVISALSMPVLAQSVTGAVASADPAAANEAAQLVPAIAELSRTLDSQKNPLDSTFEAELNGKITLSNGVVLPSHTVLIGKVTRDETQPTGSSEFAVRFSQARLKDGKTLPIKATVIGIRGPNSDAGLNDWTSQTLSVDQLNVVSGVDLHSQIAGADSAVLISTKKREVKVPAGSQLKLAIGPATDSSSSTN